MALTVSVALCTHNGERFIREQLTSILDQSELPFEIIVSDDGSTDATVEIVTETMAGSAVRLVLLRNDEPLGVTRNFEQAIGATTGDLVALSDQDDSWHDDRIVVARREFESRADLLLMHNDARLVDEVGSFNGQTLFATLGFGEEERNEERNGEAFGVLMRRNVVTGATTMFRRRLFDSAAPFPTAWVHDEWLAVIAAATGAIDYIEDQLVDYRQHPSNQIGASALTVRGKFRRVRESRAKRNAQLVARAESLVPRLVALGEIVSAGRVELARQKLIHELARDALPVSVPARLGPMLREVRSGRYATCGRGIADIIRDLIQKP